MLLPPAAKLSIKIRLPRGTIGGFVPISAGHEQPQPAEGVPLLTIETCDPPEATSRRVAMGVNFVLSKAACVRFFVKLDRKTTARAVPIGRHECN
jgi:hypothetical protein